MPSGRVALSITPTVVEAGVPALGVMLVIAVLALVLGILALWLSRRHTRRDATRAEQGRPPPPDPDRPPRP